jgi:predicted  nucleic acid-binding Zn-ribbon protein
VDEAKFLINIIVKARNELAGVMQKAAADVDRLTGAQERQARTTKNLNASIEDAKTRFHAYSQEVKGAEGDMRATEKSMRSFANEFDRLAGKREGWIGCRPVTSPDGR